MSNSVLEPFDCFFGSGDPCLVGFHKALFLHFVSFGGDRLVRGPELVFLWLLF